jgi:uncharacterized protein
VVRNSTDRVKIVIAGASGLVGRALVPPLRGAGHEVRRLVRGRGTAAPDEIAWDPAAGALDVTQLDGVDAFINLAGENVGDGRWTTTRRERILQSRVDATRTLVAAMEKMVRKPAVLLNASAIGFYGDRGDEVLTETSAVGRGFLPDVCRAWETQALGAAHAGVRTVLLRFGVILARQGGALAKMLPLFRLGLGGRMGSGQQWMSWIGINDVVGAIAHALRDERCAGPMNIVAPAVVTNAEFARVLGRVLRRPAMLPVPAWGLRIAVGAALANEALLGSQRASPQRLSEVGYAFRHATLEGALREALQRGKL